MGRLTQQRVILTVVRLGTRAQGASRVGVVLRPLLVAVGGRHLAVSSHGLFFVLAWREEEGKGALRVSSHKGSNPTMGAPPSGPHLILITS